MADLSNFLNGGRVLKTVSIGYSEFFTNSSGIKLTLTPNANQYVKIRIRYVSGGATGSFRLSFGNVAFYTGVSQDVLNGNDFFVGGKGEQFVFEITSPSGSGEAFCHYQILTEA